MIESLKDVISPDVILCPQCKQITLTEQIKSNNNKNEIVKLTITDIPDNVLFFTLDYKPDNKNNQNVESKKLQYYYQQLSLYLNKQNTHGINTKCDLVFVFSRNNTYYIFLCEMKSFRIKKEEIKTQLTSSKLFIEYILSLVKEFYNKQEENLKFINLVIAPNSFSMKPSSTDPDKDQDKRPSAHCEEFCGFKYSVLRINNRTNNHSSKNIINLKIPFKKILRCFQITYNQ